MNKWVGAILMVGGLALIILSITVLREVEWPVVVAGGFMAAIGGIAIGLDYASFRELGSAIASIFTRKG